METTTKNLAETLAVEMKQPVEIGSNTFAALRRIALPPGWRLDEHDEESKLAKPLRKRATVRVRDAESFIDYVKRHGSPCSPTKPRLATSKILLAHFSF